MALTLSLVGAGGPAVAKPARAGAPAVKQSAAVTGGKVVGHKAVKVEDQTKRAYHPTAITWPAAASGAAALTLPAAGQHQGAKAKAAGTPVWARAVAPKKGSYRGPGGVDVRVLPHADASRLGVTGVVFTVGAQVGGLGDVQVGLDYAGFAQAFGGNYASHLQLVRLPACALTDPGRAECRTQTPLHTTHDGAAKSLAADLSLSGASGTASGTTAAQASYVTGSQAAAVQPIVLAATAGSDADGGEAGSYSATALKPEGSWSGGGSTGTFSYSYPMSVPGASSTLLPTVGLSYDSGALDGQTSSTQAQASWVGDGWGTPDSYIEQTFASCSDSPEGTASPVSTSDQCYDGPILTLSLNGSSTALVYDKTAKTYTAADGNGEKVTHVTGSGNGTGTYNTDYWVVTERTGMSYMFGRNQLPGWSSGKATTHSVDSMPVYSAHSGDPCYNSAGFTSSVCTTAYKWHLDYVTDTHDNAMAYYYAQDTNYYGRNKGADNVSYVRDSHLTRIDYGFRAGGAYSTVPDQVVFGTAGRCTLDTCDALSKTTAPTQYPDVPYYLACASGETCAAYSPSFYSTVRLTSITMQQYSTSASKYLPVDTYTLGQSEPATGDGTSPTLWLSSITHTGNDTSGGGSTSSISLPSVTFGGIDLANRVDTSSFPGLYRYRISSVTNEMGGITGITYDLPDACTAAYVASADPAQNTKSCYPVYWTPKDYTSPVRDWFEKYAVTQVLETDTTGGAVAQQTNYAYSGGAAWHHDDNEVVKAKYRTWGQFRGYGTVTTLTGDGANDPQTKSVSTYYRGMDGDWLSASSTRSVTLTDSQGGVHRDTDQLAGNALEQTAYTGAGGTIDHSSISSYWVSPALATRTRTGLPDLTANTVKLAEGWSRQALTDGGTTKWRYTETDNTYDDDPAHTTFGELTYSYSHTVPVNTAYDRCAATTYAPANTSTNLAGLVASQETDTVACSGFTEGTVATVPKTLNTLGAPASVNRPDQVVSATRTFYDDTAFATTFPQTTAPTTGDVTMVRQASGYAAGAFTWQTAQRKTYDIYGRQHDSYDGNGNKTTIAYTVNSLGLTTSHTVTDPASHQVVQTDAPARGEVLSTTDTNGVVTTSQYDALGRVTALWLTSRPTTAPANYLYSYTITASGVSGSTAQRLNDSQGYVTSLTVYDSLGRTRQSQAPTPQGGRLITESFYDSHGWVRKTNNAYWDPDHLPALQVASFEDSKIPSQVRNTYDGLGRVVVADSEKYSVTKQETTTVYNGDTTTVIPPDGGVTKATVTDPLGRTTALEEYTSAPTLTKPSDTFNGTWYVTGGARNTTAYGYDGHGQKNTTTSAGSTWTSTYNLLGQIDSKTDPDAGKSSMWYDANGNLTQTEDARSTYTSTTYDAFNRKTAQYAAATASQSADNETASWVYDNANGVSGVTNAIGHLTTATSYTGGYAYKTQALGFNVFGESLGETVTIPSAAQGTQLGKSYTFKHTYTPTTGLPDTDNYPLGSGLPNEIVTHTHATALDLPNGLGTIDYGYAQDTTYNAYGQVLQEELGTGDNLAYITNTYDDHTGALTDQLVTRSVTKAKVDEQSYTYDAAGNITQQVSTRLGSSTTAETQCYGYDTLDRLDTAWTATDDCATEPTATNSSMVGDPLGAASAYWTSWMFTAGSERDTQTEHSTTGGADTTTHYAYDGNGKGQPHTLTSETAATGTSTSGSSYAYDADGNMITRNTPDQGSQSLTWNNAGKLTAVTTPDAGVSYIYDADGNLLIKADPTSKTLYLPGQQITLNTTTNTTTAVRYIALPGGGTVVRTGTTTHYNFEISDPHGTSGLYLDNTAQTPTWRQFTPYGAPRGTSTTWLDDRGFLNKPTDTTTGLTTIGAREYDPGTGNFISLDPLFIDSAPETLNGYTYTANNPVGQSDPTGLCGGGWVQGAPCPNEGGWIQGPAAVSTTPGTGAGLGSGITPTIPLYTAVSPTVLVQGDTKLLHRIAKDYDAEYRKHYGWLKPGESITAWEDVLLWEDVCAHDKGLCNQTIVDALHLAQMENTDDFTAGLMFSECEFSLDGCGKGFGGALVYATGAAQGWSGKGSAGLPETFAVAHYDSQNSEVNLSVFSGCNSFAGDTPVLMPDGKSRPISQVKPGDTVADSSPGVEGGTKDQAHTVTGTHVTFNDRDYVNVTVATEGGPKSIVGTAHHLYWDATSHSWTQASQLHVGHLLQTSDGATALIVALRPYAARMVTYNLTVETAHTYYVLAGATPVLVHNCSSVDDLSRSATDPLNGKAGDSAASRAYQKHMNRPGTSLIKLNSGKDRVDMSDYLVNDLLTNPKSAVQRYTNPEGRNVVRYLLPDVGAAWDADTDEFIGFLDHANIRMGAP